MAEYEEYHLYSSVESLSPDTKRAYLDVTDTDAGVGDTATIFGNGTEELLTLSEHAKTIPYEVLCLISSRVKRIYKETVTIQNKDTL